MPRLQNKTHIHCISSVECRSRVSTTKFQNRKHIGGYREVQKTSLTKLTKNMMENWSTGEKTLENKTVVQKIKYNNWNITWCAGMLTFSFFLKNDHFVIKKGDEKSKTKRSFFLKVSFLKMVVFKTIVFIKFVVSLTIVNEERKPT